MFDHDTRMASWYVCMTMLYVCMFDHAVLSMAVLSEVHVMMVCLARKIQL